MNYSFLKPIALLLLLGTIWGTGYSIAHFAMTNGVTPLGYSFWQSLGPALIITTIAFLRGAAFNAFKQNYRYFAVCAFLGIVVPNTSMYFAASHLPANILAIVVNIVPVIVYPLALIAGLETFTWQRIMGIVLAFAALLLIIVPKSSLPSSTMVPWVLLTLVTPFSFALCSIYVARFRPAETYTLVLSAGMLIFSSLILAPFVFLSDQFYIPHTPFTPADWVILFEIILSSLGYILFFQLIRIAGPVYYSLVDTIVVITGLFWGYIIFGESLNKWTATAVCLIICALIIVTQQQRIAVRQPRLKAIHS